MIKYVCSICKEVHNYLFGSIFLSSAHSHVAANPLLGLCYADHQRVVSLAVLTVLVLAWKPLLLPLTVI